MKTTWDDIRVIALQKMFLISGSTVEQNDSTNSYLAAMPAAYNEAVRLLSTSDRYIVKYHDIEADGLTKEINVELATEIPDLYQLKPGGIYFKDAQGKMTACHSFSVLGETLILDGGQRGTYRIYYYAYPLAVTSETAGDTDLGIDPDVASLVPLYIASQLYKDDDISIATIYRNEFEVGREKLLKERYGSATGRFQSVTGWW